MRRAAEAYARELFASRPEVEEVVVFGSFLHGNWAPGSDLDVMLLLSSSDRPIHERLPLYLPRSFPVALDVFPYTREELAALAPSAPSLLEAVDRSAWRYVR